MTEVTEIKSANEKREKRAMSISSMGLVNRVGSRFQISTPSLRGKQNNYEVWRDNSGKICCNCLEFGENTVDNAAFRCEHILAVKYALATQNSEAVTKQRKIVNTPPTDNKNNKMKNFSEESEIIKRSSNIVPMNFVSTLRNSRQNIDAVLSVKSESTENATNFDYIEWHVVADILDKNSPSWSHIVKDVKQIGGLLSVVVAITIDGVTREGLGTVLADSETEIKKAEREAFNQAALKFKIVRDFCKKTSNEIPNPPKTDAVLFPANPIAKSLSDLVTAKQLGMIRTISREVGIDADEECKKVLFCKTDELSKKAASSFITHIKTLENQQNIMVMPLRMAS
jgi:hypothetical protein